MKALRRRIPGSWIAFLVYAIARFIGLTVRLKTEGYDRYKKEPRSIIFAGWHGRTLMAASLFRKKGFWTIISLSRDGEVQNQIFQRFGFNTIRGSSGRNGVKALVESINVLKQPGTRMAFTPDGPRGPTHIVQSGIVQMAQKSGCLLVPVGVSARRRWLAKTWDSFMVPKPFTSGLMIFGDPIEIDAKASSDEAERVRLLLENEMNRLEAEAESRMGH